MNRILLDNLIVTQNRLRHPVLHIGELPPRPIVLTKTEDGILYIHDGHHRLFGLWKSGVRSLKDSYFKIKNYTYADLLDINLEVGWVTPIDFRTHCRRPDISEYKNYILNDLKLEVEQYKEQRYPYEACARHCIGVFRPWYMEPRKIKTISEFTDLSR